MMTTRGILQQIIPVELIPEERKDPGWKPCQPSWSLRVRKKLTASWVRLSNSPSETVFQARNGETPAGCGEEESVFSQFGHFIRQ